MGVSVKLAVSFSLIAIELPACYYEFEIIETHYLIWDVQKVFSQLGFKEMGSEFMILVINLFGRHTGGRDTMLTKKTGLFNLLCAVCLLFLTACGSAETISEDQVAPVPSEGAADPALPVIDQTLTTEEPFDFGAIVAGTPMQWTDGSTFVYVPAGDFAMGQDEQDPSDHNPAHNVTLSAFWIQQAEVTNQMYAECIALGVCSLPAVQTGVANGYGLPAYANMPVISVDWAQAQTYCDWIQGSLPTEAQWEKAARSTDARTYPWGEDIPTCALANYEDCQIPPAPGLIRSFPLGASPYYIADMVGNAAEWVNDWYSEDYYASSPLADPAGPDMGTQRGVRGGSFLTAPNELAIVLRSALEPDQTREDLGFRCMLTEEAVANPMLPMCQAVSYNPVIPFIGPLAQQSIPIPAVSLDVYCNLDNQQNPYGTATIILDPPSTPNNVNISSPQGNLNCAVDGGNLQQLNCSGSALSPGHSVTINICPIPPVQQAATPVCPVFYDLNPVTNLCEYHIFGLVQCVVPNVVVPGYGCMPAPIQNDCPVGFYIADYYNQPVCVPTGGALLCIPGQVCAATCPEGLVFNEGNLCCEYPPDVSPICPQGTVYDVNLGLCTGQQNVIQCTSITTPIPTCAPSTTGCWMPYTNAAGMPATHCIAPCPLAGPNNNPCTP